MTRTLVLVLAAVWSIVDAKAEDIQKLNALCKEEGARLARVDPDWKKKPFGDPSGDYNALLDSGAKLHFSFSTNIRACVGIAINYLRNEWHLFDVDNTFIDGGQLFQCDQSGAFNARLDVVRRLKGKVYNEPYRNWMDNGEGGLSAGDVGPAEPYSRDKCEQLFKNKIAELRLVDEPKW
jgi:hypothetical protein